MSSAHDTIYWAERAIGEPFQAPDLTALRRKYLHASMLSGLAFVSTITIGATAAWLLIPERPQRVTLAHFDYAPQLAENVLQAVSPQPAPARPPAAPAAPTPSAAAPTKKQSPAPVSVIRQIPRQPVPVARGATPAPVKARTAAPPQAQPPRPVRTVGAHGPQVSADLVEEVPERPPEAAPTPIKAQPIPASTPATTRTALSATAANKPQDIASGEKLGVRAVYAEGIELLNGKRIRNGERLPNGELLQATDPAKGMVETDRRVMTIVR